MARVVAVVLGDSCVKADLRKVRSCRGSYWLATKYRPDGAVDRVARFRARNRAIDWLGGYWAVEDFAINHAARARNKTAKSLLDLVCPMG